MLIHGLEGEDVDAVREVPAARAARGGCDLRLVPLLAREASGMALTGLW